MERTIRRGSLVVALTGALLATAMQAPTAQAAGCGLLGLFQCPTPSPSPTPPPPPPPPPDAGLPLTPAENPHGLQPLPPLVAGQPLYPLVNGHMPYGVAHGVSGEDATGWARGATINAGIGGTIARVPAHWPILEPSAGRYDWSSLDVAYKAYIKRGVRPMLSIGGTPRWAVALLELRFCSGGSYCHTEPQSKHLWRLHGFARALAQRYPLLGGVEYRNEPNVWIGPRPPIPAPRYAPNQNAFFDGIKTGRPGIRVWGISLAHPHDYANYLDTVLAYGARMDALSIHPYDFARPYGHAREFMTTVQNILAKHNKADMRLAISEVGTPMSSGHHGDDVWPDQPSPGVETAFDRNLALLRTFDQRASGATPANPPVPGADRTDAIIFFNATDDRQGGADFGWTEWRSDGTLQPRYLWCRWREEIGGRTRFTGDYWLAACPG